MYVAQTASFTMNGGSITGNSTKTGGGVYNYGIFTMNAGTISGNTATSTSAGGGGVYTNNGTFTVSGSAVYGNFNMTGGTISENNAVLGAGVYVNAKYGAFTMSGGSITENIASSNGGGVYVKGNFTLSGGSISSNKATTSGGGVYVYGSGTTVYTFTMTTGSVTGNTASSGGGVYNSGTLSLSGGSITGNASSGSGGGVYMGSLAAASISLSGAMIVTGNTANETMSNLYLVENRTITLTGPLTDGASVGVRTYKTPTEGNDIQFTAAESSTEYYAASAQYFSADAEGYYTVADADLGAMVLTVTDPTVYVATVTSGETVTKYATLQAAINAATAAGDTVTLLMDVTEDVTVAAGQSITLDLAGYTITGTGTGVVVTVSGSMTLTDTSAAQTGTITGGKPTAAGGGVYVNGGAFTMEAGTISGITTTSRTSATYGSGVYVGGSGTFAMKGGTISSNAAKIGGGVYIASGTFTMTNGTITGNKSINGLCGGVYVAGTSTFTMDGGSITGNTAYNSGGGVYVDTSSTFTMNGGEISGNKASSSVGGGVDVYGTFIMNGGSIKSNSGKSGGGVYIKGTFTLNSGKIADNTGYTGGGVYVYSGAFHMNGGEISGNTVTGTNLGAGGGVYVGGGTFNMAAGSITGNTANSKYGGVYVSAGSTMSLSGTVVIAGNTVGDTVSNLCLPSGKTVTLTAALTDGASIGVTTGVAPESTENGIVLITSEDGTAYYETSVQYFTSDNTAYGVVANSDNSAVVLGVKYTIHFNANGGEAIEDMAVVSGGTYKFPTSVLSGYSQAGWYILGSDNTLSDEVYVKSGKSLTVYGTEDVTLFMVRAVLAPTVKVKLTTESDVISDGYTYYYPPNSTRFLTATVTEYDGFTYTYSWAKDGETIEGATDSVLTLEGNVSDTGTYTVTVTAASVNDAVVTTNDTADTTTSDTKVTIRQATNALYYDANGGEGGPSNNFSNGVNLTVQSTEPVRDGYTFAGWNTEADGSGESYWGDDVYSFEETNNNGNGGMKATLYAQWRVISAVTLADMSQTYTGEPITASGAVVTLANGEEYDGEIIYTYYTDEACTQALDGAPVNAGTYYVVASIVETDTVNAAASDPVALTILEGEFVVTATGYTGAYDGEGHSITVTADGAEITYSTDPTALKTPSLPRRASIRFITRPIRIITRT